MTTEEGKRTWWSESCLLMTWEEWLRVWQMPLSYELRVTLLDGINEVRASDEDHVLQIRFLVDILKASKEAAGYKEGNLQRQAHNVLVHAAGSLLGCAFSSPSLYAADERLLEELLTVLVANKEFFEDRQKRRLHVVQDKLKWLVRAYRQPSGKDALPQVEEGKKVILKYRYLLTKCLHKYGLQHLIEDTSE